MTGRCASNNLDELPLETILLDFYHLSEHVGEAASKTLGAETPAAKEWSGTVLHTLRHEGYDPFLQQLLDWRAPLRGNKRQAPMTGEVCHDTSGDDPL